jgi:hypothetical protein
LGFIGFLCAVEKGGAEIRNPKCESNPNDECPNDETGACRGFGFGHSELIRISSFGFRISRDLSRALQFRDVFFRAAGDRGRRLLRVLAFEQTQMTHDGLKQKFTAHLILLQ